MIQSYSIEQLVGLGLSWVWMGLEGEESSYEKLKNVDTKELVASLQSHGIRVLGSSIIGLETHTPENIARVIDHAVSHDTDFHQFMLYTPIAGTPLYQQHREEGTLFSEEEFPPADAHGQYRFNYRHPHITGGREEQYIVDAFRRDFEVNGPSLARLIRTFLKGWQRYENDPNRRVRERFAREVRPLRTSYAAAVWAMRKWYRGDAEIWKKMDSLLHELYRTFGWITRIAAPLMGRYAYHTLKKEEARLARGWTYEPDSYCEKNEAARVLETSAPSTARQGGGKRNLAALNSAPVPGR